MSLKRCVKTNNPSLLPVLFDPTLRPVRIEAGTNQSLELSIWKQVRSFECFAFSLIN